MPYIDTLPGNYRHDFTITNSLNSDIIPDGNYYFEVNIDCYFTGDCYKMYENECGWTETEYESQEPDYYYDEDVAACDISIYLNIPPYDLLNITPKYIPYFEKCDNSNNDFIYEFEFPYTYKNNDKINFICSILLKSPQCSTEGKRTKIYFELLYNNILVTSYEN